MEVKKSPKASLENKKLLFTEIGLVVALGVLYGAFEWSTKENDVAVLVDNTQVQIEDEMIAIQNETPPPPPETPKIPVLSDEIRIVDDDIKLEDDLFMNLEDDANLGLMSLRQPPTPWLTAGKPLSMERRSFMDSRIPVSAS